MPQRTPAVSAATARVRRLQARLPELSVTCLLHLRDALDPVLARDAVRLSDVDTVLRAAERR